MKVLIIFDRSGPKYHRCLLPTFLMDGVETIVNHTIVEEQLEGVDILFFNRMVGNTTIQRITELREKYGFKIVIDFDDHWRLDAGHYLYHTYQHYRLSEIMELFIGIADAVTVTHERLANEVRPLNGNVHVLPNAIPKWGQFMTKKQDSEFTRLFWAGGITHKNDIELLRNPVKRMHKSVQMVMGGYVDNPEFKAMASAYTNGGKLNHELLNALPVEDYYHAYSKCDISLIPLQPGRFNSFKSNLKILEAANIGSPVIVSKVHPYLDFPDDLVDYVEIAGDWNRHISYAIKHKEYIKEKGKRLMWYCDEHYNFEKINKERKQIFEYVTGKQSEAREIPSHLQYVDQRQGIA